jgi:hypothetical protein
MTRKKRGHFWRASSISYSFELRASTFDISLIRAIRVIRGFLGFKKLSKKFKKKLATS